MNTDQKFHLLSKRILKKKKKIINVFYAAVARTSKVSHNKKFPVSYYSSFYNLIL